MAGLIPQSFIDDLLDRIDIVSLVDSRVKLKKTGKNYSACCPFHEEKTPSFTVSQDKQFFYCFGCGASGNALGFLIDYERLDFPDAVESLAHLAGMEVPREERSRAQIQREVERKSIYTLLERAAVFYRDQLRENKGRQLAVNYLKGRGLSGKVAADYDIGFAPSGWDNLLKTLAQNEEDKRLLIEGGMLVHQEKDGKLYDRFRDRIMFPIRDLRGRVIGFGGRVLDDSKPKYLNSPETPVFHKGKELYGLYEARQFYREVPRLLVVEGYMDVVALAQYGLRYAVATLGTACGEDHLALAFKYTSEVVFCFDGDNAGRKAARRALDAALPAMEDGRQVKFLFLPDGEDPDTLVRQVGAEKFEALVRERSVPLEEYVFDAVSVGLNLNRLEDTARLSKLVAPLLNQLPRGVFRELMFKQLATRTGLDKETLLELAQAEVEPVVFAPALRQPAVGATETTPLAEPEGGVDDYELWASAHRGDAEPPADYDHSFQPDDSLTRQRQLFNRDAKAISFTPVRWATALLMYHTELVAQAEVELAKLDNLTDPDLQRLQSLVSFLACRPSVTIGQVLGYWRGSFGEREEAELGKLAGSHLFSSVAADDQQGELREQELRDIFAKLHVALERQGQMPLVEKAKQHDWKNLSAEEREQLRAILVSKS